MVKRISEGSYRPGAVKLLQKFGYRFARFIHHLKKNDYTVPREDLGKSVVVCFKNTSELLLCDFLTQSDYKLTLMRYFTIFLSDSLLGPIRLILKDAIFMVSTLRKQTASQSETSFTTTTLQTGFMFSGLFGTECKHIIRGIYIPFSCCKSPKEV